MTLRKTDVKNLSAVPSKDKRRNPPQRERERERFLFKGKLIMEAYLHVTHFRSTSHTAQYSTDSIKSHHELLSSREDFIVTLRMYSSSKGWKVSEA